MRRKTPFAGASDRFLQANAGFQACSIAGRPEQTESIEIFCCNIRRKWVGHRGASGAVTREICSVTEIRSWRSRATQCNEAARQYELVVKTDSPQKREVLVLETRSYTHRERLSTCSQSGACSAAGTGCSSFANHGIVQRGLPDSPSIDVSLKARRKG